MSIPPLIPLAHSCWCASCEDERITINQKWGRRTIKIVYPCLGKCLALPGLCYNFVHSRALMLCDAATSLLLPFFDGMLNMASTWHFESWQLIDAKTLALATASSPVCNMTRYSCCEYEYIHIETICLVTNTVFQCTGERGLRCSSTYTFAPMTCH